MRAKIFLIVPLLFLVLLAGCNKHKTDLSTLGTLNTAQAMAMFYGNYDPVKQTSTVSFSDSDPVRTRGEPMTARPLFHTFSGEGSAPSFVLVTYAVPKSDEEYYCHACAPTIGIAVFSQEGMKWIVAASNRAVTDAGEFGKPPTDIGLVQIGVNQQAVKIIDVVVGAGETTAVLLMLIPWNHTVNLALQRIIADDDAGSCGPPEFSPCYANHRMVGFLREGKSDYFDLELNLSGTDLPLSESKRANRARPVLGDEILRLENGKYVQVKREGDSTYVERFVAEQGGPK